MPYEEFLYQQALGHPTPTVEAQEGTSGFWGKPVQGFDPRLIDGDKVRPDVREEVLKTLYDFWSRLYNDPAAWSTVWIAGSALSHQYGEHQQPDLDVLIGVDYPKFYAANPEFKGISVQALSERFNDEFRTYLHPQTENFMGEFEATFYVNAGATDIRAINPYAAYNLTDDEWTVTPVEVPDDWNPQSYFPAAWWKSINGEIDMSNTLVQQYDAAVAQAKKAPLGSISQSTAIVQMRSLSDRIANLFSDIHSKRKRAFSPEGKGYFDYYNLRWQAHKRAGTVKALNQIAKVREAAHDYEQRSLYGAPIADPETAIVKAQLFDTPYGSSSFYKKRLGGA